MSNQISVTRALAELKLLDARINSTMRDIQFVVDKKASSPKVLNGRMTVEEYCIDIKSKYQSVKDLITRRNLIKSKIVESNARTIVEINGRQYTVAEAIERKSSIAYEKDLLRLMKLKLNTTEANIAKANDKLESTIENMINNMLSGDNKNKDMVDNANRMAESYREQNKTVIIDPIGIVKEIEDMDKDILLFESEIDMTLSECNATTKVDI